jgi:hypothetical protein
MDAAVRVTLVVIQNTPNQCFHTSFNVQFPSFAAAIQTAELEEFTENCLKTCSEEVRNPRLALSDPNTVKVTECSPFRADRRLSSTPFSFQLVIQSLKGHAVNSKPFSNLFVSIDIIDSDVWQQRSVRSRLSIPGAITTH